MQKSNPEILYGALCALAMSVWTLIEFALGFHTTSPEIGQYSGFVSIIFPIVFIYVALHDHQTNAGTPLPYLDGINIGFRIAFFSALLFTIFLFTYSTYINPDWVATTIEWQRKKLILGGATDDEIEKFMEQNRQMNNSLAQTIMTFISSTGIGVFVTLVEIPVVKALFKK
ncbi:MAG: DUF4199 domain-containing protein [Ignavibacteriales bacterium]|nr:DUF4199 domain-containing protein [Ignavibacteriales bacterium]